MQSKEVLEFIKHSFELKEQGCYKQAIEMLYKVLEVESDNVEILFQIGELYYLLNNNQRAIQYLEKVLSKNIVHKDAMILLKKIYKVQKMYDEAEKYAQMIFDTYPTSANLAELVQIIGKNKKIELVQKYQNSELVNDDVNCAVAYAYYENGKCAEAKKILEKIEDCEDALVLLGKINFDANNIAIAKEVFAKLPSTYENAEVLNYRGLFYLEDLNFVEAIKSFSKALNLDKQNARYAYNLGQAYFYNGWMQEAVKAYLSAICFAPEVLDYRYSLAYLYYEIKSFDKAQKELDYILEQDANHLQSIILNALLKYHKKDFLGAKNDLEYSLKIKSDDFALTSLIKVYKELGLFENAEKILKPLVAAAPEKLLYQCDLAEILIAQNKNEHALDLLHNVLAENENYILAYGLAAQAALANNNYELTKQYAQNAISVDMNYAPGYYYLAKVRIAEQDYDEAIECMKRALMYDLNNAEYYATMSSIYKLKGEIKSALDYASEASELDNATKYKVLYSELATLNRRK